MNNWVQRDNPGGRIRLICFPHAGGGASIYQRWQYYLPKDVEIWRVQLPGREQRINEPPYDDMAALQEALDETLAPKLKESDLPFVLFGHSMGGLIAYEFAKRLCGEGDVSPALLVLAAISPPHLRRLQVASAESDDVFIEHLRRRGGTPPQVLESVELMEMLLPMLRADFTLAERYFMSEPYSLDCPLAAFAADDDPEADVGAMNNWQFYSRYPFSLRKFSGGHFFPRSQTASVTAALKDLLNTLSRTRPAPTV